MHAEVVWDRKSRIRDGGMNMLIEGSRFDLGCEDDEDRFEALVGPQGHWRERRDAQLALLSSFGLRRDARFLDMGCGALRVGLPLIDYLDPGRYVGVDIDPDCIAAAGELIERFDLAAREPLVLQSTSFGRDELGERRFDRIWCFQVFIHLTEALVHEALAAVATLLDADGIAWVTLKTNEGVAMFETFGSWRSYTHNRAPVAFYEAAARRHGLALTPIRSLRTDPPPRRTRATKRDDLLLVSLTKVR